MRARAPKRTGSPARRARRRFPMTIARSTNWRSCAPRAWSTTGRDALACGPLRPYKWYVAAYRIDRNDSRWTKVIGVLTERNWVAETGRIHAAGDHGPNPAAEIAMQIVGRQAGLLPWSAH